MKKLLLGIFLAVLLFASTANAAIVNVYFDETLDLTKIHGFGFNVEGALVDDVTLDIITTATDGGAVPDATGMWDIYKSTANNSIDGYDVTFGYFNLSDGLALTLTTTDTAITLSGFYLAYTGDIDGKYPLSFTILEDITSDGINYTYAESAVPVPSTMILLGFGICALFGIKRKK